MIKERNYLKISNLSIIKSHAKTGLYQLGQSVASGIAAMGLLQLVKLQVASTYRLQQSDLQH